MNQKLVLFILIPCLVEICGLLCIINHLEIQAHAYTLLDHIIDAVIFTIL